MAKAKRKTGLDKFNKVLFILLIIAIVAGGLVIGLSSAKVPVAPTSSDSIKDEVVIDEFKAGTYAGQKFDSVDDVVAYYNKAYDYTKSLKAQYKNAQGETVTLYKLLGSDALKVDNILIDGASNSTIDGLVPGIVNGLFTHGLNGLSPSRAGNPADDKDDDGALLATSRLKADDLLAANVAEKDGKVVITLQPKLTELSTPGKDPQGNVFTTLGDITATVKSITVLTWAEGDASSNIKVRYYGGTATVTIDPKTNEVTNAEFHEVAHIAVTHANITIIKNKNAEVTVKYDMTYPATDEYLKEYKQLTRV